MPRSRQAGAAAHVAGGVVEAGWLVALAIVPLEVAVGADRPFEPAKAVLLQALAVVTAGAWLLRRVGAPVTRPAGPAGAAPVRAFVAATAALAVVATAGTALSLSPTVSLAGSSARSHGLLTLVAVWVIAVVAATELRSGGQVTRLLHVATVAAVPVAAVALLQRHGIDAVPVDRVSRPGSTFGNPLLLAGWLVTVTPLVAARLGALLTEDAAPDRRDRRRRSTAALIVTATAAVLWWTAPLPGAAATIAAAAALWAVEHRRPRRRPLGAVVAAQAAALGMVLAALVATASRGPILGLAGGAVVATLALAAGRRRDRLRRAASAGAIGIVAGLAVLAVVTLRGGEQAGNPSGAIGAAVSVDRGTFAVRDELWAAGDAALEAGEPLPGGDGDDPHAAWRPIVGYGPDVTDAVLGQYAAPKLWRLEGRDAPPDRAHNAILDAVLQFGWLGGAALVSVFAVGLAAAMGRLRMLARGRARVIVVLLAVGVAGGAAAGAMVGRSGWWAPGAGVGLVVAVAVALAGLTPSSPPTRTAVVVTAGCTGALVAHWVELQGGVETVASMTTWWIVAAVLVAPWRVGSEQAGGDTDVTATATAADALAVVTGLIAGTAAHAGSQGRAAAAGWAAAVSVAVGVVLIAPPTTRKLLRAVAVAVSTAFAVAVPAATLADRGEQGAPAALAMAASVRMLVVVAMLLALGAALAAGGRSAPRPGIRRVGAAAVTMMTGLALLVVGVGPAVAGHWRAAGVMSLGPGEGYRWATRADRLDPSLHGTVASATAALRAAAAAPPEERARLLGRARDGLASAVRAFPFSAEETIALADLHVALADEGENPSEALAHGTRAARLYSVAADLRPGSAGPRALEALAWTDLASMQPEQAQAARASASSALAEAARLDPAFVLVPAVRAALAPSWPATVDHATDAFAAIRKPWARRDRFDRTAASVARETLAGARRNAEARGEEGEFVAALSAAAGRRPTVEAYLEVARMSVALGDRARAAAAVERGRAVVAPGDHLANAALDAVIAPPRRDDVPRPRLRLA